MARYDDLNTKMIAYSAILSIVVLVLVLQGTQALCYNMVNWVDSKRTGSEADKPAEYRSEQLKALQGYGKARVLDESVELKKGQEPAMKDVFHIPVPQAEQLILKEYRTVAPSGA
ncbi:MAG: hypothetical protein ACK5OB_05850 [Pirellula sp.]